MVELFNTLLDLLQYALTPIGNLIQAVTVLPSELTVFISSLGDAAAGFGVVIGFAFGALVLRIIINLL